MYELPYFQALIKDRERFLGLFHKLDTAERIEHASELIHKICKLRTTEGGWAYSEAINQRASDLIFSTIDRLANGQTHYAMPMVVAQVEMGYFGGSQSTLHRMMARLDDADDEYDCHDYIQEHVGITRCDHCEEWEFDGRLCSTYTETSICRDCQGDAFTYIDRYDCYVNSSDVVPAINENGHRVSVHEYDEDFIFRDEQGMRVHVDYDPPTPSVIAGYHSSKNQISFKHDSWTSKHGRFLGVELEVETMDRYLDLEPKAHQLNDAINGGSVGSQVFFERDGSLSNGFEIVTNPMSLPAHRELWKWLENKSLTKGLISHKGRDRGRSNCGLHIHVNRDRLSKLQIAKIVAFVNSPDNRDFISALARRYGEAMTGFCRIKDEKAKVGKALQSSDRYEAVNVTPKKTIEFRIFRGTLKYESLVAAIEFVHALCEYTASCGDCSAANLGYESFLKFAEQKLPSETKTLRSYVLNRLETA
jgi:hypothetical protein